ncbi:hypothetical protein FFI16_027255 [Pseudomonas sp. KBS0710]|nr:hypothetical protein FFI16_027255 [Pseudomonas sp. KBS0710]
MLQGVFAQPLGGVGDFCGDCGGLRFSLRFCGGCSDDFASKPAPTFELYSQIKMWERACSRRSQWRRVVKV